MILSGRSALLRARLRRRACALWLVLLGFLTLAFAGAAVASSVAVFVYSAWAVFLAVVCWAATALVALALSAVYSYFRDWGEVIRWISSTSPATK